MGAVEGWKQAVVDRLGITRVAGVADDAAARTSDLATALGELDRRISSLEATTTAHGAMLAEVRTWMGIERGMAWASAAPLRWRPTIDVVVATRDRADLLAEAIDSVCRQTYANWRLVVVDDGSTDATPGLLANRFASEPRLEVLTTGGIGAAAARNAALDVCRGEWVAFLDDDNAMHPGWLRAIAELTGREPNVAAVFGAQLREDSTEPGHGPWLLFDPTVTLEQLRRDNAVDLNAFAIRRDHPELRFDPARDLYIDWEMIERVFTATPLRPIPVLASIYTLRASSRISDRHDDERLAEMRSVFGARRQG